MRQGLEDPWDGTKGRGMSKKGMKKGKVLSKIIKNIII